MTLIKIWGSIAAAVSVMSVLLEILGYGKRLRCWLSKMWETLFNFRYRALIAENAALKSAYAQVVARNQQLVAEHAQLVQRNQELISEKATLSAGMTELKKGLDNEWEHHIGRAVEGPFGRCTRYLVKKASLLLC